MMYEYSIWAFMHEVTFVAELPKDRNYFTVAVPLGWEEAEVAQHIEKPTAWIKHLMDVTIDDPLSDDFNLHTLTFGADDRAQAEIRAIRALARAEARPLTEEEAARVAELELILRFEIEKIEGQR